MLVFGSQLLGWKRYLADAQEGSPNAIGYCQPFFATQAAVATGATAAPVLEPAYGHAPSRNLCESAEGLVGVM